MRQTLSLIPACLLTVIVVDNVVDHAVDEGLL